MTTNLQLILDREIKRSFADHLSMLQKEAVMEALEKSRKPFIKFCSDLMPYCELYHEQLKTEGMLDSADTLEKIMNSCKTFLNQVEPKS